jgi:hypothetical protein
MGVLHELLIDKFKVETRSLVNPVVAAFGAVAVMFLRNNPDRLGFVIFNLSVNPMYISPLATVGAAAGIPMLIQGDGIAMVYDEDFEMVGYEWYGIAPAGASAIYVLEIVGERGQT